MQPNIEFDEQKNLILKETRGVNFDDILNCIKTNKILGIVEHYNKSKYIHQSLLIVKINNYAYVVPFVVKNDNTIFLKTVFPSRKYKKLYIDNYAKPKT